MKFWRRLLRPEESKNDLDAEIESHFAIAIKEKKELGLSDQEALAETKREFGNVALAKDTTRKMWGWERFENLQHDTGYALRQLKRNKVFAFTAILIFALGVAASTAIFAFVDAAIVKPLPYRDSSRLLHCSRVFP